MDLRKELLVGIVVVFSPSLDQMDSIKGIAAELDAVFVIDNTENGDTCISPEKGQFPANVRIIVNGNVGGIAGALNIGIKKAKSEFGECYLILLDQDSCLPKHFFETQYLFAKTNNRVVVAPKYFDINSKTYGNYTLLSKWRIKNIYGENTIEPFEVTFAITSGTLIHSDLFDKIGLFREDFFIDHVDSEFCVRLHKSGNLILINPSVVFEHAIGNRIFRTFLGVKFKPNFHSPLRRYYAVRNGIFMVRHHVIYFPSILWLIILRIGYEYAGIVLFENYKLSKLKALIWGVIDGVLHNAGRCNRSFQ